MISSDLKSEFISQNSTRDGSNFFKWVASFFVEDSTDPDVRRMRLIRGVKKGHKELFYMAAARTTSDRRGSLRRQWRHRALLCGRSTRKLPVIGCNF